MRFVSRSVKRSTDEHLLVTGDLTIRGTTRSVVLHVDPISPESKDPFGMIKVGTSATTTISRKDFGLVWNAALETGGVAVGDEVTLTLDLHSNANPKPRINSSSSTRSTRYAAFRRRGKPAA